MTMITEARGAFDEAEHTRRVAAVRAEMRRHDLGALVITSPENIYYLIGLNHQGYFAFTMLVFAFDGPPVLLTRGMESYIISKQAPDVDHVGYADSDDAGQAAVRAIHRAGVESERIGVDTQSMYFPPGIWEEMETTLTDVEWFDTSRSSSTEDQFRTGIIDHVRLIKSQAEIEYLKRAAAISDRAVRAGLSVAGVGANEKEVAARAYRELILGGSEYPGFAPLIRSSETLLEEHSTWSDRVLVAGDRIFLELSGAVGRYHAPLTRMAYLAAAPPRAEEAQATALSAFAAARETLRPGVETGDVYAAWQAVVDDALGHDRLRRHHCGYNVGIGFPPSWVGGPAVLGIRPEGKVKIQAGMAFHMLSWITDPDLPPYMVSDSVLVTGDGTEVLTTTRRPLVTD